MLAFTKRESGVMAFVSHSSKEHGFRAVRTLCLMRAGGVEISKAAADTIHAREGEKVGVSLHAEHASRSVVKNSGPLAAKNVRKSVSTSASKSVSKSAGKSASKAAGKSAGKSSRKSAGKNIRAAVSKSRKNSRGK